MAETQHVVDANEAAASVAYRVSEAIAIYPITPSSPMAELCDEWSSRGQPNLWGVVPQLADREERPGPPGERARRSGRSGTYERANFRMSLR